MTASEIAALLSRKRLLILDFDGTIVDSSPLHARAFSETFAPEGIDVDYATIAGMTTAAAVDKLALGAGLVLADDRRDALIAEKRERALALIEADLEALEGSVDFLDRARSRFALALCTSGSRRSVETALAKVGLTGRFEPLITAEDVQQGKPHPEGFLAALAAHRLDRRQAVVFEDAESGLQAAEAAGMDAIHIVAEPRRGGRLQANWAILNAALDEVLG